MASAPPAQPLADRHDRDRFTTELHQNFCVSASAGAGKTTAIVRRISALALASEETTDDPLARLVVVTYTRAAAAELRVRARHQLQRDLTASPDLTAQRLRRLNAAFFGTLHSFTLELLRRHGGALGLPVDVQLLEERDHATLWNRFLADETALAQALDNPFHSLALRHSSFSKIA
ncbi:MAG: UvrD-helicase domain-containing protein, partial [Verrucomicrobiia bacterium]